MREAWEDHEFSKHCIEILNQTYNTTVNCRGYKKINYVEFKYPIMRYVFKQPPKRLFKSDAEILVAKAYISTNVDGLIDEIASITKYIIDNEIYLNNITIMSDFPIMLTKPLRLLLNYGDQTDRSYSTLVKLEKLVICFSDYIFNLWNRYSKNKPLNDPKNLNFLKVLYARFDEMRSTMYKNLDPINRYKEQIDVQMSIYLLKSPKHTIVKFFDTYFIREIYNAVYGTSYGLQTPHQYAIMQVFSEKCIDNKFYDNLIPLYNRLFCTKRIIDEILYSQYHGEWNRKFYRNMYFDDIQRRNNIKNTSSMHNIFMQRAADMARMNAEKRLERNTKNIKILDS